MSRENVGIIRAGFDALNRDDWDALRGLLDSDVEWETTGQFVGRSVYRGHDGVREFLDTLRGEFDEFRSEPEILADSGDVVVVETRSSGVGKRSRARVVVEFTIVVHVTNGRITRLRNFMDKAEALEATGLRE